MLKIAHLQRRHRAHSAKSPPQVVETPSAPTMGSFARGRDADAAVIQTDFKCLDDGPIFEIIEDVDDSSKTRFAVWNGHRAFLADEIKYRGGKFIPLSRNSAGLEDIQLPRMLVPYVSPAHLFSRTHEFITGCVDLPKIYSFLASFYVIYDWVADLMPMAVYLHVTGLPQSGKSTLLEVLALICRRPLLVSEITPAAVYDVCTKFTPTLLVDESELDNSPSSRALRRQLRAGTSRKLIGKRSGLTSHTFGPKVLCSLELPSDAALNTRCMNLPMQESNRHDLKNASDPAILQSADELCGALLQYRLENYRKIAPRSPVGAEHLRPRSRDMVRSLAGALRVNDPVYDQVLVEYFRDFHDPANRDVLSSKQSAALAGLVDIVHPIPAVGAVWIGELSDRANRLLKNAGEHFTLSPRKLSPVLDSLGFSERGRAAQGKYLLLDQQTVRRIHDLWRRYGSEYLDSPRLVLVALCPYCREGGATTSTKCDSAPPPSKRVT
jgi:hypothetical protein